MICTRVGAIATLWGILGSPMLHAEDLSTYRGLRFGMSLGDATKRTGTNVADAKPLHQRPALIQELEWNDLTEGARDQINSDPVHDGLLYFLNGALFRIVVTYDRYKVEGMTSEDLIESISRIYGTASKPVTEVAYHSNYGESTAVLARWEDSEYCHNLVRTGDRSSFALVMYSKKLDATAQVAIKESARLDALEAPQRKIEKQRQKDEEERLNLEKARSVNRPNFRP